MKSLKLAVLAISLIGIFGVGNVMAIDTADIVVSATVLGTCSLGGSTTLAFGDKDPSVLSGDWPATTDITVTCTNGTTWTLAGATVTDQAMTGPGTLTYSVSPNLTTALGNGAAQTVTLTGSIPEAVYTIATPGVYADSFTISVTP